MIFSHRIRDVGWLRDPPTKKFQHQHLLKRVTCSPTQHSRRKYPWCCKSLALSYSCLCGQQSFCPVSQSSARRPGQLALKMPQPFWWVKKDDITSPPKKKIEMNMFGLPVVDVSFLPASDVITRSDGLYVWKLFSVWPEGQSLTFAFTFRRVPRAFFAVQNGCGYGLDGSKIRNGHDLGWC